MHSISFGELAIIFGIIIVLFGGSRLASVGKSLGEGIANFKKGISSAGKEETAKVAEGLPAPSVHVAQNQVLREVSYQKHADVVDAEQR